MPSYLLFADDGRTLYRILHIFYTEENCLRMIEKLPQHLSYGMYKQDGEIWSLAKVVRGMTSNLLTPRFLSFVRWEDERKDYVFYDNITMLWPPA